MRIAVFSVKKYDQLVFTEVNAAFGHDLVFFESHLTPKTARLAHGFDAVCPFVNDDVSAATIQVLASEGVRLIALRSAGFNHVDLAAARERGLVVARVPAYSPHAVAEHAMALILTLNRRLHKAYARVRDGNFSLDGLLGFDLHGKTIGVIGTGKIGCVFSRILSGFGCRVLTYDIQPNPEVLEYGATYVELPQLLGESDIIALHLPLMPATWHMINDEAIAAMKPGVMLINTSRGGLIDTRAVIAGLKSGKIGGLGLDVYEEEADLFFEDMSGSVIQDDVFARLLTFPNVLITGHQGFFTREALHSIAETTLGNATAFETGTGNLHKVELDSRAVARLSAGCSAKSADL
jgi:D-lactate dehydrogenase